VINIDNTGERIIIEKETPLMVARHLCAYKLAKDFVSGKKVLDIGSGEGYGSGYLADFAKEVTGLDYSESAIAYAQDRYRKNNLKFLNLNIEELYKVQDKFDVICSFQVIEHIKDTGAFLSNVKNLLNKEGKFICSTPNRLDASPHTLKPHNPFHVKEYLIGEFESLLKGYFKNVEIVGLIRGSRLNFYRRLKKIGIFNLLPKKFDPVKIFYSRINSSNFAFIKEDLVRALDFISINSD
jgi:2-polyprenyl-3-methyl-5-hydroxy-6-metoxy-1,4-benzoquinol methylase